jgi:hypothetical protein
MQQIHCILPLERRVHLFEEGGFMNFVVAAAAPPSAAAVEGSPHTFFIPSITGRH